MHKDLVELLTTTHNYSLLTTYYVLLTYVPGAQGLARAAHYVLTTHYVLTAYSRTRCTRTCSSYSLRTTYLLLTTYYLLLTTYLRLTYVPGAQGPAGAGRVLTTYYLLRTYYLLTYQVHKDLLELGESSSTPLLASVFAELADAEQVTSNCYYSCSSPLLLPLLVLVIAVVKAVVIIRSFGVRRARRRRAGN